MKETGNTFRERMVRAITKGERVQGITWRETGKDRLAVRA